MRVDHLAEKYSRLIRFALNLLNREKNGQGKHPW